MTTIISHVYDTYAAAQAAVNDLQTAGVSRSDISILASNADGWYNASGKTVDPKHDKDRDGRDDRTEDAEAVGGLGLVAGGALGALTGLGLLAIPGVGPVVAAGWLAATAAGAATGGVAGGIIGALAGSGISKENAELYVESLRRGGTIVTARVSDADKARYDAVLRASSVNVAERATTYRSSGWTGYNEAALPYNADQVRQERALYNR